MMHRLEELTTTHRGDTERAEETRRNAFEGFSPRFLCVLRVSAVKTPPLS